MDTVLYFVLAITAAGQAVGGQHQDLTSALAFDYLPSRAAAHLDKPHKYRSLPPKRSHHAHNNHANKTSKNALVVPQYRQQQAELVEDVYDPALGYVQQVTGDIYNGAASAVQTVVDTALHPVKSIGAIFGGIHSSLQSFFDMIGLGDVYTGLVDGISSIFDTLGVTSLFTALQPAIDQVVEALDYASPIFEKFYKWTRPLQVILALEDDFLPFLKAFRFVAFANCLWKNKYGFMDGIYAGVAGFKPCAIQGLGLIPGLGTLSTIFGLGVDLVTYFMNSGGEQTSVVGGNNLNAGTSVVGGNTLDAGGAFIANQNAYY